MTRNFGIYTTLVVILLIGVATPDIWALPPSASSLSGTLLDQVDNKEGSAKTLSQNGTGNPDKWIDCPMSCQPVGCGECTCQDDGKCGIP